MWLWVQSEGTRAATPIARVERRLGREPTYDECLAATKKERLELPTGLADVRIHDLRHSFASGAVALGESLPMIGKLLGHTQVQTTARYAHLAADPVKAAAERVSTKIAALMDGGRRTWFRCRLEQANRGQPQPRSDNRVPGLSLTLLALDVTQAVLESRQPKSPRLATLLHGIPLAWDEQRRTCDP